MEPFAAKYGPWALVTGASSGIGRALAEQVAARNINVLLVGRDESRLREVAARLENRHSIHTRIGVVDLASDDGIDAIIRIAADLKVGLLVNNAGCATYGDFLDQPLESQLRLISVNVSVPAALTHHFGNLMKNRGGGGVIFVSSLLAFAGIPDVSEYAATKAHGLAFVEGFAVEAKRHGIDVAALCPGATKSSIWPPGSLPLWPMDPERVAGVALHKMGSGKVIIPGALNRLFALVMRLCGRTCSAAALTFLMRRALSTIQSAD